MIRLWHVNRSLADPSRSRAAADARARHRASRMRTAPSRGARRARDRPGVRRADTRFAPKPPPHVAGLGSPFFSEGISENGFVERQIRDRRLESPILFPQLLQLAELAHIEPRVLLLPAIERRLRHAHLPADVDDGRPALGLPQRLENLLRRELALAHLWPPLVREF